MLNFACKTFAAVFGGSDVQTFITIYASPRACPEEIVFFKVAGGGWRWAVRVISVRS
jgi:hypothetical protein